MKLSSNGDSYSRFSRLLGGCQCRQLLLGFIQLFSEAFFLRPRFARVND
jgi:hypothetical protein